MTTGTSRLNGLYFGSSRNFLASSLVSMSASCVRALKLLMCFRFTLWRSGVGGCGSSTLISCWGGGSRLSSSSSPRAARSRQSKDCEKFLRMGSRSSMRSASSCALTTSSSATGSTSMVGGGAGLGTRSSLAKVVPSAVSQTEVAVNCWPSKADSRRFSGKLSHFASAAAPPSRRKRNLYSTPPAGKVSASEDQIGKRPSHVASGKAFATSQAPRASGPPVTKTTSPGCVERHSTSKITVAMAPCRSRWAPSRMPPPALAPKWPRA
mmetsp:Transcript_59540/g.172436  ORF Transcript_59540/g.172436 Transcript_59540/m.172436 type:complete len:266 (+) Transcript_59540:1592-2389(+)